MSEILLRFDCTKEGIQRPDFLSVKKKAIHNIYKIILYRPKDLIITIKSNIFIGEKKEIEVKENKK